MSKRYIRPLLSTDRARPDGAHILAGGWCWFDRCEILRRGEAPEIVAASALASEDLAPLIATRVPVAGLSLGEPRLMGILNVTPDSFSDGGKFLDPRAANEQAQRMVEQGADILDIGGESTRPGAAVVPASEEIARTEPVIRALAGQSAPISIDTRKAPVAEAALAAGAALVNDVAAFTYDPALAEVTAKAGAPVCLMHAQGDPETMQDAPRYEDVLLDVYDFLAARIAVAEAAGITLDRIIVDPGIGFGKTQEHNLALLRRLSLFHSLGCPILLGASRKRFIGAITGVEAAQDRVAGSVAVALAGRRHGVQITRVHDITQTKQAFAMDAVL